MSQLEAVIPAWIVAMDPFWRGYLAGALAICFVQLVREAIQEYRNAR